MAQLGCSVSMICLTAFEATLTMHDLFLFMRFAVYTISVLIQILYWCYYGNRVSYMVGEFQEQLYDHTLFAIFTIGTVDHDQRGNHRMQLANQRYQFQKGPYADNDASTEAVQICGLRIFSNLV